MKVPIRSNSSTPTKAATGSRLWSYKPATFELPDRASDRIAVRELHSRMQSVDPATFYLKVAEQLFLSK